MAYIAGRKSIFDYVHIIEEHLHGQSKCHPSLQAGVTILSGAIWTLGNYVELIPAGTIGSPFDVHWLIVESVTDDETYELVYYNVTTEICRVRWSSDLAAGGRVLSVPIPTQMGIQAADSQIQCKLASSGAAETIVISVLYHTY